MCRYSASAARNIHCHYPLKYPLSWCRQVLFVGSNYLYPLANGGYNGLPRTCECYIQPRCPFKTDFGVSTGLCHELTCVLLQRKKNKVYQAGLTANVGARGWRREIPDSIGLFRQRFNGSVRNTEASEVHLSAGKAKVALRLSQSNKNPHWEVNGGAPMYI